MKKTIISFLALITVFLCIPVAAHAYFDKTSADAVAWVLGHQEGVGYEYDGAVDKYIDGELWIMSNQCVDLIRGYMDYISGTHTSGNAGKYTSNYLPDGYTRIQKYGGFVPAKGDILIWSGDPGHVAICTGVNSSTQIIYSDQNGAPVNGVSYYKKVKHNRTMNPNSNDYWGVIRPDFKPSAVLDVNGWLDENNNAGNITGFGTFDVYIDGSLVANDVTDYYNNALSAGSSFLINDIKPTTGHMFCGAVNNSYSGNLSEGITEVRLRFKTCVDLGSDFYAFVIWANQNKFLENGINSTVINSDPSEYAYSYEPVHIWRFIRQNSGGYTGSYKIVSAYDGNVLDAKNFGTDSGTELVLHTSNDSAAQRWYITPDSISEMYYCIGTTYGALSIDAAGSNGRAHLWTANYENANQVFAIYKLDDLGINYAEPAAPTVNTFANPSDPNHVQMSWSSSYPGQFDRRVYHAELYAGAAVGETPLYQKSNTTDTSWTLSLEPGTYTLKVTAVNTKYENKASTSTKTFTVFSGYSISYNANGGVGAPAEQTKRAGETIALSNDAPTRTGYTFLGWATSANATAAQYQPGASYSTDADLTLYAVWRITNPPTLVAHDVSMLLGDTRDWADFVELRHDGVLNYTLTATAGGVLRLDGEHVTASALGSGALIVSVAEYPAATCTVNVRVVDLSTMLQLPSALSSIEEEAFAGSGITAVKVPSGCRTIGSRAFANNAGLVYIYIPSSVTQIAPDAFENSPNTTIYCYPGSAAASLAASRNIRCVLLSSDWVRADELPLGAAVTEEKWTYQRSTTETTTSTATSLAGWTRGGYEWQESGSGTYTFVYYPGGFDTTHPLYSAHEKAPLTSTTSGNTKRVPGSAVQYSYIYWHWTYADYVEDENRNVVINDTKDYGLQVGNVYRDFVYFDAFETTLSLSQEGMTNSGLKSYDGIYSTYHHPAYNLPEYASWWWYRTEVYRQSYTDYQKLFTYTRTVTSEESSSVPVVEGNGISNVQHWVKYTP